MWGDIRGDGGWGHCARRLTEAYLPPVPFAFVCLQERPAVLFTCEGGGGGGKWEGHCGKGDKGALWREEGGSGQEDGGEGEGGASGREERGVGAGGGGALGQESEGGIGALGRVTGVCGGGDSRMRVMEGEGAR